LWLKSCYGRKIGPILSSLEWTDCSPFRCFRSNLQLSAKLPSNDFSMCRVPFSWVLSLSLARLRGDVWLACVQLWLARPVVGRGAVPRNRLLAWNGNCGYSCESNLEVRMWLVDAVESSSVEFVFVVPISLLFLWFNSSEIKDIGFKWSWNIISRVSATRELYKRLWNFTFLLKSWS